MILPIFLVFLLPYHAQLSLLNAGEPAPFFNYRIDPDDPGKVLREFEAFVKKYNRTYATKAEKQLRFNNFAKNHDQITSLNDNAKKSGSSAKYGINNFSDWSSAEFSGMLSHSAPKPLDDIPVFKSHANRSSRTKRQTSNYPRNLDLRDAKINGNPIIGPVKNQGACGCCWAFSGTAITETAYAIANGEYVSLSDQEMCDCATQGTAGCIGGDPGEGIRYVGVYGQTSADLYPYEDGRSLKTGRCRLRSTARVANPGSMVLFRFEGGRYAEEDIIESLNTYHIPVAVYFRVGKEFEYYESGVHENQDCNKMEKTAWHSMAIVGYGTTRNDYTGEKVDYWILKNSWSDDWGEDGYVRVIRGINWCDIENSPLSGQMRGRGRRY